MVDLNYSAYLDEIIKNGISLASQAGTLAIRDQYTPTASAVPRAAVPAGAVTTQSTEAGKQLQEKAGYWFPFGDSFPIHKNAAMIGGGAAVLALIVYFVRD